MKIKEEYPCGYKVEQEVGMPLLNFLFGIVSLRHENRCAIESCKTCPLAKLNRRKN